MCLRTPQRRFPDRCRLVHVDAPKDWCRDERRGLVRCGHPRIGDARIEEAGVNEPRIRRVVPGRGPELSI